VPAFSFSERMTRKYLYWDMLIETFTLISIPSTVYLDTYTQADIFIFIGRKSSTRFRSKFSTHENFHIPFYSYSFIHLFSSGIASSKCEIHSMRTFSLGLHNDDDDADDDLEETCEKVKATRKLANLIYPDIQAMARRIL